MARRRSRKGPQPKKVSYVMMETEEGEAVTHAANKLIQNFHHHLRDANIGWAWARSWKADPDGTVRLGKAKKLSDPERSLTALDFIIIFNEERYNAMNEEERMALIDHELTHCEVAIGTGGEIKRDEKDRIVFRIRKHDFEEFAEVARRHRRHTKGLVNFAQAAQLELWAS